MNPCSVSTARLDNRRKTGRCNTVTPEVFRKGGSNRNAVSLQAPIAFVRGSALPKHFGRFAFYGRVGLHPIARADVLGRVEQNRVRLLTSQRSKPSRGTCGNRQIGNDARSSRYERLEDESSRNGAAVLNRMAESMEVSLLGLSYDLRGK